MIEKMTETQLKDILTKHLSPDYLQVIDQSELHAGHKEAKKSGGGHYHVTIVANAFDGQTLLKRHQMIYKILNKQFPDIHALSIQAYTPAEWQSRS